MLEVAAFEACYRSDLKRVGNLSNLVIFTDNEDDSMKRERLIFSGKKYLLPQGTSEEWKYFKVKWFTLSEGRRS